MTTPPRPIDVKQWDCIVDLLATEQARLSQTEVQQELRRLGINVSGIVAKIRTVMDQQYARAALIQAQTKRVATLARVNRMLNASFDAGRDELVRIVRDKLRGPLQAAMFSRLGEAASEDDLKSLLADLAVLDELRDDNGGNDAG